MEDGPEAWALFGEESPQAATQTKTEVIADVDNGWSLFGYNAGSDCDAKSGTHDDTRIRVEAALQAAAARKRLQHEVAAEEFRQDAAWRYLVHLGRERGSSKRRRDDDAAASSTELPGSSTPGLEADDDVLARLLGGFGSRPDAAVPDCEAMGRACASLLMQNSVLSGKASLKCEDSVRAAVDDNIDCDLVACLAELALRQLIAAREAAMSKCKDCQVAGGSIRIFSWLSFVLALLLSYALSPQLADGARAL
eukprot:TRINITY_DN10807_c0_g1_i1.p1 TRINITY_DN10807_c0_g1~~TRINITY_DN10807_c0_g1_i1.p1  ORF type:complete len:272 (-),score=54.29 TRINITY_DN10807_c0_g1_i1:1296-2051(-)